MKNAPEALLKRFFPECPRKPWIEILIAWAVCTPIVILLGSLTALVVDPTDASSLPDISQPFHQFAAVLVGPLLETLVMIPVLALLKCLVPSKLPDRRRTLLLVVSSAAAWAVFHGCYALPWGVTSFWGFLIYSYMLLRWEKAGLDIAIGVVTSVHALNNATAVLLFALLG